jgi:hypothetical protein
MGRHHALHETSIRGCPAPHPIRDLRYGLGPKRRSFLELDVVDGHSVGMILFKGCAVVETGFGVGGSCEIKCRSSFGLNGLISLGRTVLHCVL